MPLPLVHELIPPPDPGEALRRFASWPMPVLFDSAKIGPPLGRYAFLTADPFWKTTLDAPTTGTDPFTSIREKLNEFPASPVPGLPSFTGGAAGVLTYELGGAWERLPQPRHNEFDLPAMAVGLYDWAIAWDLVEQRAWIVSHGFPEKSDGSRRVRAQQRMERVRATLSAPAEERSSQTVENPAMLTTPQRPVGLLDGLVSNFSREEYLQAVKRVVEYIRAGDIFQANLSQRLLYPLREPALEVYLRLRECNAAPFAGYFACDDWALLSASPERFVRLDGDHVETRPIKGTRQRRFPPEADLYTQDELQVSSKDIAENVMIVDLLRNDLSRVCRAGSIRVPQLCQVETYETVHHLVSEVCGTLRPGKDAWDLFAATFPGGSITGAPKVRAMEIITELEQTARGAYCGSLFYVGFDGRMDSSILIRTLTARRGWLQLPAGGGVVAASLPEEEYAETLHKARGMLRALFGSHQSPTDGRATIG